MNVSRPHLVSLSDRRVTSTGQLEGNAMAMNRVQFQAGLSMPNFLKDYGSEAQCEQALEAIRLADVHC
jgi:hypothetical protein